MVVSPTRQFPKDDPLYWENRPTITWVQVTSIGVDALSTNDQLITWATNLRDGAPLAGVHVQLGGTDNAASTDADGLARLPDRSCPLPDRDARAPTSRSFPPTPSTSGIRRPVHDSITGFAFDDRGIYRPGETVHVKGWFRRVRTSSDSTVAPLGNVAHRALVGTRRVRERVRSRRSRAECGQRLRSEGHTCRRGPRWAPRSSTSGSATKESAATRACPSRSRSSGARSSKSSRVRRAPGRTCSRSPSPSPRSRSTSRAACSPTRRRRGRSRPARRPTRRRTGRSSRFGEQRPYWMDEGLQGDFGPSDSAAGERRVRSAATVSRRRAASRSRSRRPRPTPAGPTRPGPTTSNSISTA